MTRNEDPFADQRDWKRPRSMTTWPSGRVVWKSAPPSPVSQMETVSVSPGQTGLLNRPYIDWNRAGSDPHSACSRARPVTPYVHSPCRIGRSNPPRAANFGSAWSGFRSPDSRPR